MKVLRDTFVPVGCWKCSAYLVVESQDVVMIKDYPTHVVCPICQSKVNFAIPKKWGKDPVMILKYKNAGVWETVCKNRLKF